MMPPRLSVCCREVDLLTSWCTVTNLEFNTPQSLNEEWLLKEAAWRSAAPLWARHGFQVFLRQLKQTQHVPTDLGTVQQIHNREATSHPPSPSCWCGSASELKQHCWEGGRSPSSLNAKPGWKSGRGNTVPDCLPWNSSVLKNSFQKMISMFQRHTTSHLQSSSQQLL